MSHEMYEKQAIRVLHGSGTESATAQGSRPASASGCSIFGHIVWSSRRLGINLAFRDADGKYQIGQGDALAG